ncbi:MAG: MATE family efflux transporter [Prolixibacteraceae bacterium]|jgi:putative MATE family efflux protein|nr:MATE family efflux transporter [Prolixibacteraceae bacterium]
MSKTHELGNEKIGLLIKKFYWPAFISVSVSALYNIVDRIFIGQGVGAEALSGVSIVFPIMLIFMAFGMLFGVGTGVNVSIRLGEGKHKKAEQTLGNGLLLMILVSVFVSVVIYFVKDPLLEIFGATDITLQYAGDYLLILLPGIIFQVVGFSLNNVIRSEGNARVAMKTMLLSAGSNIILDPIFIFGFGMGVKGAALATVVSMFFMSIWVLLYFIKGNSVVHLYLKNMKLRANIVRDIILIGMAPFSMQLAASVVQGLLNMQLVNYGNDIAVAANGIIMSVSSMILMSVVAVNMAIQPIIGFNFGAKNYKRVKETLYKGIVFGSVIAFLGFIVVQSFPGAIVKLFNDSDIRLYEIGTKGLSIGMSLVFLIGFQVVMGNYFQSTGKAKLAMFISLLRQVIVLIPMLFVLPQFFGLDGVWMSMPVSSFVSALIVAYFFRKEQLKLNELIDSKDKLL